MPPVHTTGGILCRLGPKKPFSRPAMTRATPTSPPAAERTLRLLSCNILAGASVQRYSDYVTRSVNAVLPGSSKLANLDSLAALLHEFDVVGLQEVGVGTMEAARHEDNGVEFGWHGTWQTAAG